MRVVVRDLTAVSLEAISGDPLDGYRPWLKRADPEISVGLAGLGWFAFPDDCDRSLAAVASHRARIQKVIGGREWRSAIDEGIAAADALLPAAPEVLLYVLVGPSRSDGSAAVWGRRGIAFVWLESWLGSGATGQLQDRPLRALPITVSHELAHAVRAGLPGTPLNDLVLQDPADMSTARTSMPLRLAMYDEGLATAFAMAAHPESDAGDQLSMSPDAIQWLERHWQELLDERSSRWDLSAQDPPVDAIADALFLSPSRARPPWTIERPPAKWGYYVGLKWAQQTSGDWITRLASAPPRA